MHPMQIQYLATRADMQNQGWASLLLAQVYTLASASLEDLKDTYEQISSDAPVATQVQIAAVTVTEASKAFWGRMGYKRASTGCTASAVHMQELQQHSLSCPIWWRHIGQVSSRLANLHHS